MATIARLLETRPRLRYVFTGGKGGVGKTVTAAALAHHFARQGRRTLLASLNPVHSLSSVFGQDLAGGTIRPVAAAGVDGGLFAAEVEATEVIERYRVNIAARVKEFLKWADIPVDARPFVDIAVTNPAFEEAAMFDRMVDIMLAEGTHYDTIVFDTAAVANAVRLIGLSKIYGLWLGRMIQSRQEALAMKIQYAFRKEKVMEEVRRDPLMADLLSMHGRFREVKGLLVDPEQTAFFFVTLPLALPIAVVKRFIGMVCGYDIAIGGVVVNQVISRATAESSAADEYLQGAFVEQLRHAGTIRRDLGDLVRGFIPLYPQEVAGASRVARVADDLLTFVPDFWKEL